jgi:hypothetical protein
VTGAHGAGDVFGVFGVFIVVAVEPVGLVFFGGSGHPLALHRERKTTSLSLTPTEFWILIFTERLRLRSPGERESRRTAISSNDVKGFGDLWWNRGAQTV